MRHGHFPFARACAVHAVLVVFAVAAPAAHAHVTLDTPTAAAGTYYKAVLNITHGCEGSPVTQVIVDIPAGAQGAKPRAKPGWSVEIERARLAEPYTSHGRTVTEDVARVRWTGGPLADAQFDEFVLSVKLPERAGPLYWKVAQVCEKGRIDWAEIPAPGQSAHDLKSPAAVLDVQPAEHAHHAH